MNYQADVARDQGDSAAARTTYEQSLAIFRELDERWGIAGTLADLGRLASEQENYPRANSMYRESMKLFQELRDGREGEGDKVFFADSGYCEGSGFGMIDRTPGLGEAVVMAPDPKGDAETTLVGHAHETMKVG